MGTDRAPLLTVVLALLLLPADGLLAQVGLERSSPALIDDLKGRTVQPLGEQLKLEVEWAAKVGGLEPPQTELLLERGAKAVEKRGGLFLQGKGRNERAGRRWQIFDGRVQLTQDAVTEPLNRAIRRTLMPLLGEISPDAAARVRTERDRLDSYRKQASIMAQVAVLDECLLLSVEQRTRFGELLAEATSDAWWRPTNPTRMLDTPTHRLRMLLAERQLGEFIVPDVDLAKLLRASQVAAFMDLRQPVQGEVLLSQSVPPGLAAATLKEQAAVARGQHGERPGLRPAENFDGARVEGSHVEGPEQRLTRAMNQCVEDIDSTCELTASQREKLVMAGKLDVERVRQAAAVPQTPADNEVVVETVRFCAGPDLLAFTLFRDDASYFARALQRVLRDEQKRRLNRSRRDFQRRSLVESAVVGFECSAALTAAQCGDLSRVFNEALADGEPPEAADWRTEFLRRIAELPPERFREVLCDFQMDAARRQQQHLAHLARQFTPSVESVIVQTVRDKSGRLRQVRMVGDGGVAKGALE